MEYKDYNQTDESQQNSYDYQQYDYQQTDYNNQQYNNYNYQQYANVGGGMVDAAGNPVKSYFAVQLVFAIVEILLCCFSPVAMVLGIIALVFAVQANTAYTQCRAEEFKSKSKTSNILLIVGGVFAAVSILLNVIFAAIMVSEFEDIFSELENELRYEEDWDNEEDWDDEDEWMDEGELEEYEDVVESYPGTDTVYLVEGFADFTYNGVAYSIPMSYDTFTTMGYTLEEGFDEEYVFDAQTYETIWFYDEEGYELGRIRISNDTEDALALKDCVVDYIYFDNPASYIYDGSFDHIDLVFGEEFDMLTTYEELEAWLGTPYYICVDNSTDSEFITYEWTYYGDDKYQSIVVNYIDGVITDIAFEQYDFVY
ncbi:MAG: hypothetical protein IJ958_01245 [Agathobacter sp.]|nr:hypothetical protein [Agathobacter sp.]